MMRFLPLAAALWIATAGGFAMAQEPPVPGSPLAEAAETANRAATRLRDTMGQLDQALSADDQVIALGQLIRGYEEGLSALRVGLRQAGMREQQIRGGWEQRRESLGRALGAMMAMQQSPEATMLLHPAGAEATAHAGMILSDVAPSLRAEAEEMQAGLSEIATIRAIQEGAANDLAQSLSQLQQARQLLASAVTDRSSLPQRFGEDPEELRKLAETADTLESFAAGVARLESDVGPPLDDFEGAQGSLALPVTGEVIRAYDQPDAAGVRRPGLVIATAPATLVASPWSASIRYRGPLLDYGNVMILEPAKGYLLVLAGLGQVFGEVGDVIQAGEPVGLMGGTEPPAQEFGVDFVVNASTGASADRSESLYLELRKGNETLDPAEWFVMNPVVDGER